MSIILEVLAVAGALGVVLMWTVSTLRHRSHLSQCLQDLRRLVRLNRRLAASVADMEHILDQSPRQADQCGDPRSAGRP